MVLNLSEKNELESQTCLLLSCHLPSYPNYFLPQSLHLLNGDNNSN